MRRRANQNWSQSCQMSDKSGAKLKLLQGRAGGGSDYSSPCISNGSGDSRSTRTVPLKGARGVYISKKKTMHHQHTSGAAGAGGNGGGGRERGGNPGGRSLGRQWWRDSGNSYLAKPSSSSAAAKGGSASSSSATTTSVWFEHWHTKLFILWVFFMALVSLSVYLQMNAEMLVRRRDTLKTMCEGRARMLEVCVYIHTYPWFPEVSTHVLHSFRLQACPMLFILVQFEGHSFVVGNVFFFFSSSMPARNISWRWSWRALEAFKGEFSLMKLFLGFRWLVFLGEFLMKHLWGFWLLFLRHVFCFCRTNSWQVWIMCEHWLHSSPHCTSASR